MSNYNVIMKISKLSANDDIVVVYSFRIGCKTVMFHVVKAFLVPDLC